MKKSSLMKPILLAAIASLSFLLPSCQSDTSGSIVFWSTETSAQAFVDNGISTFYFYLNGTLIGSQGAATYFEGTPDCDTQTATSASIDLEGEEQRAVNLKIEDQDGNIYIEQAVILEDNTCLIFQVE